MNAKGVPTLHLSQELVGELAVLLLALAGLEVDADVGLPAQLVEGLLGLGPLRLLLLLGGVLLAAPSAAASRPNLSTLKGAVSAVPNVIPRRLCYIVRFKLIRPEYEPARPGGLLILNV